MTTTDQMINAQWFIEVKIPGRGWAVIAVADNDRLSPYNQGTWEDAKEEFPIYPLRIKAYVRWSDVWDQQQKRALPACAKRWRTATTKGIADLASSTGWTRRCST